MSAFGTKQYAHKKWNQKIAGPEGQGKTAGDTRNDNENKKSLKKKRKPLKMQFP